jgi:hypothetical protein
MLVTFFFAIIFVFHERHFIIEYSQKESFDYIRHNNKFKERVPY